MHLLFKLLLKLLGNVVGLVILARFLNDFVIADGFTSYVIVALVLTILNIFVRPILKLITFPFILLTFGLFNIVLHIVILYLTDALTTTLSIGSPLTLFWASLLLGILNSIL